MRISNLLSRLTAHCAAYRSSVDQIFSADLSAANGLQRICCQIQLNVSELQVDRHRILALIAKIRLSPTAVSTSQPKRDIHREQDLRNRLRERLQAVPVWDRFTSDIPLARMVGLVSTNDYIQGLLLHLPEIYEETLFLERWSQVLLKSRSRQAAAELTTGLQHMGRNHISELQLALDWLSDEDYWS